MPGELMNADQVARYLNVPVQEVLKLAARGHLPARKVAGGFQFRKGQVDHWIETQMHELPRRRMEEIEKGVSDHHGMDAGLLVLAPLIPVGGVVAPLSARSRDSAIRDLVDAADASGLIWDKDDLVEHIRHREDMCSTAIYPGVALPHPRHALPHHVASSFVIVGRTASGIPYGAPDGGLTRLLFLICCKDERTHLHVLARISLMLDASVLEALLSAADAEALREALRQRELAVLGGR